MRERTSPASGLYSYRFEDVEFNEASFQLLVGGRRVETKRKPLEVLALLFRHVREVVTKDELPFGRNTIANSDAATGSGPGLCDAIEQAYRAVSELTG